MNPWNIVQWIGGALLVTLGLLLWVSLVAGNTTHRGFRSNFGPFDTQEVRPGCSRMSGICFGGLMITFGIVLIVKAFARPF